MLNEEKRKYLKQEPVIPYRGNIFYCQRKSGGQVVIERIVINMEKKIVDLQLTFNFVNAIQVSRYDLHSIVNYLSKVCGYKLNDTRESDMSQLCKVTGVKKLEQTNMFEGRSFYFMHKTGVVERVDINTARKIVTFSIGSYYGGAIKISRNDLHCLVNYLKHFGGYTLEDSREQDIARL